MKHIISESGGIGSYLATKRVIERHGAENVIRLFADTKMEDQDLYRFLDDTSKFLGVPITRIADGRTPWHVFFDEKFLGNSRFDPCSRVLKRELLDRWVEERFKPNECVRYVGIDWSESHRYDRLKERKKPYICEAPMTEAPYLTKAQMRKVVEADGIRVPRLYDLGFSHNNCGGFCVKAGQGHFKLLLEKLPERYAAHEQIEALWREKYGDHTILRRQRNKLKEAITLQKFREEIEAGSCEVDEYEIGGCGCAID